MRLIWDKLVDEMWEGTYWESYSEILNKIERDYGKY